MASDREADQKKDALAREAERPAPGLVREFFDFLRTRKKWWLAPIVLALLFVGLLAVAGGSSVAPVIYALF